jgi:small conductance mechanosensitive channel
MDRPVKVVRASGTIVAAKVSIGYEVSRHQLEDLFVQAGEAAELQEPFVQVVDLGDYSVVYRVAGFLPEPCRLLASRSKLRGAILETLSEAGVEIMSPMYMARREVNEEPLLPHRINPSSRSKSRPSAEDRVFDKAEFASGFESQRNLAVETQETIAELKGTLAGPDAEERAQAEDRIAAHERRLSALDYRIEHLEALRSSE